MLEIIQLSAVFVIIGCYVYVVMTTKADIAASDTYFNPIVRGLRFWRAASSKVRLIILWFGGAYVLSHFVQLMTTGDVVQVMLAVIWMAIWGWGFLLGHRFLKPIYQELDDIPIDTFPSIKKHWSSLGKNERLQWYVWLVCFVTFLLLLYG